MDKPESDSESENDPFADINETGRDIVKLIDLDCACVLPHYLNRHFYYNDQTLVTLHYFNSAFFSPITVL